MCEDGEKCPGKGLKLKTILKHGFNLKTNVILLKNMLLKDRLSRKLQRKKAVG
jgi:hypothetical protein